MLTEKKIVMVGAGNLAQQFGSELKKNNVEIIQVYNRSETNGIALAEKLQAKYISTPEAINPDADFCIVAVADNAINEVISKLPFINGILVHTSGSTPMEVLATKAQKIGVIYPLQSFTAKRNIDFSTIPIALEANNEGVLKEIYELCSNLNEYLFLINSAQRAQLHLAAVFCSNFTNYLYSVAYDICKANNLSFDLLKPLIIETIMRLQENEPDEVQTGPAKRKDFNIIEKHLELLQYKPEYKQLYQLLTELIIKKNS